MITAKRDLIEDKERSHYLIGAFISLLGIFCPRLFSLVFQFIQWILDCVAVFSASSEYTYIEQYKPVTISHLIARGEMTRFPR